MALSRSPQCKNDSSTSSYRDIVMRKMIMLAFASFLWKQVQKRMGRGAPPPGMQRRGR
jgi:hypothetical protein